MWIQANCSIDHFSLTNDNDDLGCYWNSGSLASIRLFGLIALL